MTTEQIIDLLLSNKAKDVVKHLGLKPLSRGSSRIVYIINDDLVLKMPGGTTQSWRVGVAQNREEVRIALDPGSKNLVAKIYACHPNYLWIIAERCQEFDPRSEKDYIRIDKLEGRCEKLHQKYGLSDFSPDNSGINKKGQLVVIDSGYTKKTCGYYGQYC